MSKIWKLKLLENTGDMPYAYNSYGYIDDLDKISDDDIKKYSTENVDRGTITINGNDCLYRITKHYVNGVYVYWRYYLLFDDETGKVFLASFYDTNNSTNYVNELLESVKFE